jgi:hypothetical protein
LLPRRLAWHSEQACDDRAITLTGAPIPYARHLLEFAGSMVGQRRRVMLGIPSMSNGSDLRARIEAVLDRSRAPLARGVRLLLVVLALVVVPAIAGLRVGSRALGAPAQRRKTTLRPGQRTAKLSLVLSRHTQKSARFCRVP